jgi:hypothetical protein
LNISSFISAPTKEGFSYINLSGFVSKATLIRILNKNKNIEKERLNPAIFCSKLI